MKRILACIGLIVVLAACSSDASKTDLNQPQLDGNVDTSHIKAKAPDSVTVYINVDQHPNVVKLCIEGLAFRTVSTTYSGLATPAVDRVPEWDASCKSVQK